MDRPNSNEGETSMRNSTKRILAWLMTVMMLVSCVPDTVLYSAAARAARGGQKQEESVTDTSESARLPQMKHKRKVTIHGRNGKKEVREVAEGTRIGDLAPVEDAAPMYGWLDPSTSKYLDDDATIEVDTEIKAVMSYVGNFKGESSDNGITMTVVAPQGTLPENVRFRARPQGKDYKNQKVGHSDGVAAIDLTFFDQDSMSEVEPLGEVQVTISGLKSNASYNVLHITDEGAVETVASNITGTESYTFGTAQFSVYAVVETGDNARLYVNFINDSNEEPLVAQMIVKKSDISATSTEGTPLFDQVIYDPGVGEIAANEVFRGWTSNKEYTEADIGSGLTIDNVKDAVKAKLN